MPHDLRTARTSKPVRANLAATRWQSACDLPWRTRCSLSEQDRFLFTLSLEFNMGTSFAKFMATASGRVIRVAAGLALMAAGVSFGGRGGLVLGVLGLVPTAAGVFNFCLISPLIRAPFWGRQALAAKT